MQIFNEKHSVLLHWNLFLAQNVWYSLTQHRLQHPFPPCQSWENTLVMATRPVWVSPTRSAHHCYLPRWTEWPRTITAPPQIGHIVNLSTGPLTWKWGVKCLALALLWASCHGHATHWVCQPPPPREGPPAIIRLLNCFKSRSDKTLKRKKIFLLFVTVKLNVFPHTYMDRWLEMQSFSQFQDICTHKIDINK